MEQYSDTEETEQFQRTSERSGRHSTVDFLLRRMSRSETFPSISKYISEINQKLASKDKYASASDLANVVLKDFALTTKLLKLVNSAFHGIMTKPINTVSRAIVLLGFEQVRMTATSIILFEHLRGKGTVQELKDSVINSFASAIFARKLGEKLSVNPEEAFVCAMFLNLGKHLVVYHLPEEYKEIERTMAQRGVDEQIASRIVLGRTYNDLGIEIADAWKFSEKIKMGMKILPGVEVDSPRSENAMLQGISNFANERCAIIGNTEGEERKKAVEANRKRFKKCLSVSEKVVEELLDSLRVDIEKYSEILDVNVSKSKLVLHLTQAQNNGEKTGFEQDPGGVADPKEQPAASEMKPGSDEEGVALGVRHENELNTILITGIQEISGILVEDFDLNDLTLMIVETMLRGFCFDRVLFCMMEPRKKRVQARFGLGRDMDKLVGEFSFKLEEASDVFNTAVSQARDFLIGDTSAPEITEQIPEWYRKVVNAPAFLIYPIFIDKICLGLFYADKEKTGTLIPENQQNYMKTLRNQLISAIKQRR